MRPLALTLARASGRGRAVLVVLATALASALLLVAVSIARLGDVPTSFPDAAAAAAAPTAGLVQVVQEPGTRTGAVVGVLLLVVPLLLLLDQAVRLGSSSRQRRQAALVVAGATRADLRRWGALEVGLPAAAGAVLGVPLWLLLRLLLGTLLGEAGVGVVPARTGPGPWALLVVAGIAAYGVLAGVRGGRVLDLRPGLPRLHPAPRPWGWLVLAATVVLAVPMVLLLGPPALVALLAMLVLGLGLLSPWLAHRAAVLGLRRARSAAMLLALGRLVADPGPPGRAAAAIGGTALVGGVIGPFLGAVQLEHYPDPGYYVGSTLLVALLGVLAAGVVAATLAIHSTETVLERHRELAALVATGVPPRVVARSQLLEVWVATLPLAALAALLGSFGFWVLGGMQTLVLWPVASLLATLVVVAGAGWVTHLLVRPWVRDAVHPAHLRTE